MRLLRTLTLALLAWTWSLPASAAACHDSVFSIRLTNADVTQDLSTGSAILLDQDRWLFLTPAHLVAESERIFVFTLVELVVVQKDEANDIALLAPKSLDNMKFWRTLITQDIRPLALASESPPAGDVVVCSYPLRAPAAERAHIVPVAGIVPNPLEKQGYLRFDKPIQYGESGGAILDSQQRLVGMVVTLVDRDRNPVQPSVAIPVEKLRQAVLRATQRPEPVPGPPALASSSTRPGHTSPQ